MPSAPASAPAESDRRRLRLLEAIGRGDSVEALLAQLAHDHEALFPGRLCSVVRLDASGRRLHGAVGPSLPPGYLARLEGLEIGPTAGSCGAACATGRRVVVEDVQQHPNWAPYRALAAEAGLAACWSEPIIGGQGQVLGSFAVYLRSPGGPAPEELDHLSFAAQLAAVAIAHGAAIARVHATAEGLARLNRAYAVLTAVNEAIVAVREALPLYAEVCRIAVAVGGFSLAWVARTDEAAQVLRPLVQAGIAQAESDSLSLRLDAGAPPWLGPLLMGAGQLLDDLDEAAAPTAWRAVVRAHGGRTLVALPLGRAGRRRDVLFVGAASPHHVDEAHRHLLDRLARDLAHAQLALVRERAQAHERHFREQLIESIAGLFFVVDEAGRLLQWNRQLALVSGRPTASLVGLPALLLLPAGAQRRQVADRLRDLLDPAEPAGTERRFECELLARDGRSTPYLLVVRRIDRDGQPLLVGTGIDLSERVRTEQELARHREQLEALVATRTTELETANARLFREDRRLRAMLAISQRASSLDERQLGQLGVQELARLTGSPAAGLSITAEGSESVDAAGLHAWHGPALVVGDGPAPWQQAWALRSMVRQVAGEGGAPAHALCVPIFESRQLCVVLCVAHRRAPYNDTDERDLVLIGSDLWRVLRRRRIELALEQAKRAADAASQAKSAFLANMSHEIRTPMNAIIGFAHLLGRDPLSPSQRDHLARITEAGQHLMRVINDILDFSKIEAHKVELSPSAFALRESVERVVAMVGDRARDKGVGLSIALDGCPPQVVADRMRLEQVLLNLVSNAVKFTQHGQVAVRVRPLAGAAPPGPGLPAPTLRFEVADTGIGIAPEQTPTLFEAFEQGDASTTRRFGGTGLGLAICKRLVELMQGRIGVDSTAGVGSTFWFELALAKDPTAEGAAAAGASAGDPPRPPAEPGRPALRRASAAWLIAPRARWPLLPAPAPRAASAVAAAPPAKPPALADTAAQAPATGAPRGRVLLAEDNLVNQEVAADLLGALGMRVVVVGDGAQAVDRAAAEAFDLVLMDVQMPVMDGLRATGEIRRLEAASGRPRVPIVAMTANAFDEDRDQCLAAGMDDYLAKPVAPPLLQQCLARWLPTSQAGQANEAADVGLRARLAQVPGLSLAQGLQRVHGQWPLYRRVLVLFAAHHGGDVEQLATLAASGDADGLRRLAHSLSGAAATLGAQRVHEHGRALELALGAAPAGVAPGALQALAGAAANALADLLAALQAIPDALAAPALPPGPPAGAEGALPARAPEWLTTAEPALPQPADARAVLVCLQQLAPLLASHDTAACERIDEAAPLLQAALGGVALTLRQQIHHFSFEDARATLAQAMQQAEALVD